MITEAKVYPNPYSGSPIWMYLVTYDDGAYYSGVWCGSIEPLIEAVVNLCHEHGEDINPGMVDVKVDENYAVYARKHKE